MIECFVGGSLKISVQGVRHLGVLCAISNYMLARMQCELSGSIVLSTKGTAYANRALSPLASSLAERRTVV